MAFAATVIGPLLLILSLYAAHAARRWVENAHVADLQPESPVGLRNTREFEAQQAVAITSFVVAVLGLAATPLLFNEFSSPWAALALFVAALMWLATAWPKGRHPFHPSALLLRLLSWAFALTAVVMGQLTSGVKASAIILLLIAALFALLRWDDELLDAAGVTNPVPDDWRALLVRAEIPDHAVRTSTSTRRLLPRHSGRIVFPADARELLSSHQALEVVCHIRQTNRLHSKWWLRHDAIWPTLVAILALAPSPGLSLVIASPVWIGLAFSSAVNRTNMLTEVTNRLAAIASDPIGARSFAGALQTLDDFGGVPPGLGKPGFTSQAVGEALGVDRDELYEPPKPWPLTAKMLSVTIAAAAIPLVLAGPTAWALGQQAQVIVAVGTDIGSDVTSARREAALIIDYGDDIDLPDVAPFVDGQRSQILQDVDDQALHDAALALYIELADGCQIRPELYFFPNEPDQQGRLCEK